MPDHSSSTLNDRYLRLIGIPLSVLAVLLAQMPFYFPGRWDLFCRYSLISLVFTTLMWEISRKVLLKIRQRFPALEQTRRRIFWMLGIFVLQMGTGQAILTWLVLQFHWSETTESFLYVWALNFASSLFFIVLLGSIYEAIYFFGQYKNSLRRAEMLKKQQAQASFDALKNRVNPHFLFNSLTTLSALIGEDAQQAERFVDELSKVYRHLLRAGRQPTMTVAEELDFAKSYVFLLENRFAAGDFLFEVPQNNKVVSAEFGKLQLPALTFQNALDYLIRTQHLPLSIRAQFSENALLMDCENRPKTLAFDASDNDWQHLELQGAKQHHRDGRLVLEIPYITHSLVK